MNQEEVEGVGAPDRATTAEPPASQAPRVVPPTEKRFDGRWGCAVTLVVGLTTVFGAWLLMRVKAHDGLEAASRFDRLIKEGQATPAAKRASDLGCAKATWLRTEDVKQIAQSLENSKASTEDRHPKQIEIGTDAADIVVCASGKSGKSASCEELGASLAGEEQERNFVVVVEDDGLPSCTMLHETDSIGAGKETKMKSIPSLWLPPIFDRGS